MVVLQNETDPWYVGYKKHKISRNGRNSTNIKHNISLLVWVMVMDRTYTNQCVNKYNYMRIKEEQTKFRTATVPLWYIPTGSLWYNDIYLGFPCGTYLRAVYGIYLGSPVVHTYGQSMIYI